jgi:hypothetical protein
MQPGGFPQVVIPYWLTRGDLGTCSDALALATAIGQTPSTAAVSKYRSKAGIGLNLEQQLALLQYHFYTIIAVPANSNRNPRPADGRWRTICWGL